jgi:TRAP-type C4-dicarboxylate transport system substrate-binding protein
MHRRTPIPALLGCAVLIGMMPSLANAQGDTPVTLRFAISDEQGRPSEPYVDDLVSEVAERSGGSVTLMPIWDAGGGEFEAGVARLLLDGDAEVGLVASRAWDLVGVTSLQALQAPFLIDSDALALAVSTSPVADDLLASMSSHHIEGLSMWPEDLRHPATFESCHRPIVTASDLDGLTLRTPASGVTLDLMRQLGASWVADISGDDVASCRVQAVESGLRQGQSLPGLPTFTADVTFFPKFQVIAANQDAMARLSQAQRSAIIDGAVAVRDRAVKEHPSDAQAATEWCAAGGQVVVAGAAGIASFQAAAGPVLEHIVADPAAAAAVASIGDLKSGIAAPAAMAGCEAPTPSVPVTDPTGYLGTTPPNGSYRAVLSADDLAARGASSVFIASNAGTFTYTFDHGHVRLDWIGEAGNEESCAGTVDSDGTRVRLRHTDDPDCFADIDILWRPDGDGIRILLLPPPPEFMDVLRQDYIDLRAALERTWHKVR